MEEIVVLDYNLGEVHIYSCPVEDININDFLRQKGHKPSECNWMFGNHITLVKH